MAKSCVMNKYVIPRVLCNSIRRLAICACTEQSRAESASSRIKSLGSSASARAMVYLFTIEFALQNQRLNKYFKDAPSWVQRACGILKYKLDLRANMTARA